MTIETLLILCLLAAALWPVGRRVRGPVARSLVGLCFLASVAGTFWWEHVLQARETSRAAVAEKAPGIGRPGGYVSSDNCRSCHPQHYDS